MTEIEAKFIIRRPEQVDGVMRAFSAAGFDIAERGTATHVDRYVDTEDWAILRAGWACRIRRRGDDAVVTLKSLQGPDGSVFAREEISQPLPAETGGQALALPPGPVQARLAAIVDNSPFAELFLVTSERTVYEAARSGIDTPRIELDLDRTRIDAEKRTEKATGVLEFTELELELLSGTAAQLESVAAMLRDDAGLMPAKYSKYERGLQAAGLEIDALLEPPPTVSLGEDEPVLTLLYQYLAEQLQIVRRQHPRALEGIDPEGVHQMRVASRRLRAILKAFREFLGEATVAHFNAELRWLAQNLGRARDADVTARGANESDATGTSHYEQFLAHETISAYEHLVHVLQNERSAVLEDELSRFIAAGPDDEMRERYGNLSIAACADQLIHAALAKLLAHGDEISAESPARQLHKLRIETKRFRYLLDFFSTVQIDKWLGITEAVKKIQDILGEHQDAVTAQAQLADYAAHLPEDAGGRERLSVAAGLMQAEAERITDCRQQFAVAWSEFRGVIA